LVYPSFYEGFGMPPLEAMACGTPVITSHVSSLGEVVGDAGLLIDPYNVSELADAMAAVRDEPTLAAELRRRGLERAKRFSWDASAKIVDGVFSKLER
jgi:glycosyltransferase involved in cell wall biosynthesis